MLSCNRITLIDLLWTWNGFWNSQRRSCPSEATKCHCWITLRFMSRMRWGAGLWVGRGSTFPYIVLTFPTCTGVPGHRWVPGSGVTSPWVGCFVPAEWAFRHLRILQWLVGFRAYPSPLPVQRDFKTSSPRSQAHHESIRDFFSVGAVLGR